MKMEASSSPPPSSSSFSSSSSSSPPTTSWRSCFRNGLFTKRIALVTGGGTGIGRAIATELAYLGATVIIASRNHESCQLTSNEINNEIKKISHNNNNNNNNNDHVREEQLGKVIAGPSTNIRNAEQVHDLVSYVIETYGGIHILINNAGGQFISPAEDISQNGFRSVIETNLIGTFIMCKEVYNQYMSTHDTASTGFGCCIVNITLGNRNGMPYMVHSGASRSGIENMTATLCTEWMESSSSSSSSSTSGGRNSGVRINCVRPGIIYTQSGFDNYGPAAEEYMNKILHTIPAKRLGTAQEISSAVVWLCSPGSSYVTGTVLCVDGGSSYTFLPLLEIDDKMHLPYYGELPTKARL